MKKNLPYIILILLLFLAITGGTFAFLVSNYSTNNSALNTTAMNFEVIYTGGSKIEGPINIIKETDNDLKLQTTVNIGVSENSVEAKATLYINVETITSALSTKGFVWEVIGIKNEEQVYYKKGNFDGINNTTNNIVNIVEDYKLDKNSTAFTVYLWLDGNLVGNEVLGSEFKGHIGAQTESFQAALQ